MSPRPPLSSKAGHSPVNDTHTVPTRDKLFCVPSPATHLLTSRVPARGRAFGSGVAGPGIRGPRVGHSPAASPDTRAGAGVANSTSKAKVRGGKKDKGKDKKEGRGKGKGGTTTSPKGYDAVKDGEEEQQQDSDSGSDANEGTCHSAVQPCMCVCLDVHEHGVHAESTGHHASTCTHWLTAPPLFLPPQTTKARPNHSDAETPPALLRTL